MLDFSFPSIEISSPEWATPSPVIEDFASYSIVLQDRVFRDLFDLLASSHPRSSVGTLMSEGLFDFSSILQVEESSVNEEVPMRRSSVVRASSHVGQLSSVKPLSPLSSSKVPRRVPAFSASLIPSTITNEELAVLRVRFSIPSSVTLRKPSESE